MSGGIDSNTVSVFDFTKTYEADMNYKVVVPLAVGPEFSVVIQQTILLDSIIGEMLSGSKIGLDATILCNIPLDLELIITPVDADSVPLPGIEPQVFKINAGKRDGSATETKSEITFDDKDKHQLVNMRGVRFEFRGKTGAETAGIPLKPDNFIQARLHARIEGGVTIDLNELIGD
jgi:hypothetical protein